MVKVFVQDNLLMVYINDLMAGRIEYNWGKDINNLTHEDIHLTMKNVFKELYKGFVFHGGFTYKGEFYPVV